MDIEVLRAELDQRLGERLRASGLTIERDALFSGIPAMETPAESAIVRAAERLTGVRAGAVAFATEGPYFNDLGHETVILGPGHIDQAHQPDEYLALDQIPPARRIIRALIERFCCAAA
jgi:acetylornithine deacetylase